MSDDLSELALTDSGAIPPDTNDPELEKRPGADTREGLGSALVVGIAIFAMAITLIPYLFGYSLLGLNPRFGWYSWLGYNLDDSCVYLSWMRQAADGHLFQRNLFTTEPQIGHQVSLFFLALGSLARVTHLPLIAVWHGARVVLGIALIRTVSGLIESLVTYPRARVAALLFVCLSAGFGWVPGLWTDTGFEAPVDVWQPEAITFLSLYLNPLYLVSLLLMIGVLHGLYRAEQTRSIKPALFAGLCGFLLGNIHTYDVITVAAIWATFLVLKTIITGQFDPKSLLRGLVAAIPTAVSTGYTYYALRTEDVFAKRAAVATLSASPHLVALGYGLLLLGALAAFRMMKRPPFEEPESSPYRGKEAAILLAAWAVANIAVSYVPLPFQRKMLMGAHIPLAILAGLALGSAMRDSARIKWILAVAFSTILLCITNVRFMLRDMTSFRDDRTQSMIQRPYLYAGERRALEWIRAHTPADAPVQPLPWIRLQGGKIGFFDTTMAALAPGLTGRTVHAGHWGETPDFGEAMGQWRQFQAPTATDQDRTDLLRLTGVKYLIFTQKHDETGDPATESRLLSTFRGTPPEYLRLIPEASNEDADVYEVSVLR